MPAYMQSVL